jgi:TfoX/Sxy family transcriptional regulator of competence genes
MAYDEELAERVRTVIGLRDGVTEKKMFGGLAFLQDGKLLCGILNAEFMVRVGPERYEAALLRAHVRRMDFTGRTMNGYVLVSPGGTQTEQAIIDWVDQAASFVATLGPTSQKRGKARPTKR